MAPDSGTRGKEKRRVPSSADEVGPEFRDGEYQFYLTTLLRIHQATVIDADFGYKAGTDARGSILLKAGPHPFRLYYVHGSKRMPQLGFNWSGPGIDKGPVPAGILSHSGK